MGMKESRVPPHLQANRDLLAAHGVAIDASGRAVSAGMQGGLESDEESGLVPPDDTEILSATVTKTVSAFGQLDNALEDDARPGNLPAGDDQGPAEIPGEKPVKGLDKREADAREAQREMSKTQKILQQTVSGIESRFAELASMIDRLTALQVAVGNVPETLKPADEEIIKKWEADYGEALSVMDARVAPLYRMISALQESVNGLVKMRGEEVERTRESEVESVLYSKISRERAKVVANSAEFADWYRSQPTDYKAVIKNAIENTSGVDPRTTLKVFRDFAADTGIDVGFTDGAPSLTTRPQPRRDSFPTMRGGGAAPSRPRVSRAADETTPLSIEEMNNYQGLLASAPTEQERILLRKRMANTNLLVAGESAQILR